MSITTIEWTQRPGTIGETWNPTTGCNKVSQGCKHCYAETMHKRLRAMHQPKYQKHFLDGVVTHPDTLTIPLQWKKPRTVFVNSMSDLFHADVPFAFIDQVFAIMALTPQHTYQILTKRPERMAEYFDSCRERRPELYNATNDGSTKPDARFFTPYLVMYEATMRDRDLLAIPWPLPNVWLGTSCEDQATANERIPHLLRVPAAVRFLSCEPLLGPINLRMGRSHQDPTNPGTIHWVIAGGESGPNARPMHPDWARSLRDQCGVHRVPFFFKQWGHNLPECQASHLLPDDNAKWLRVQSPNNPDKVNRYLVVGKHASGNLLDGRAHQEYPGAPVLSEVEGGTAPPHVTPSNAVTPGKASAPRPGVSPMSTEPATT